eukprot:592362-Amphidinium_carterae.1
MGFNIVDHTQQPSTLCKSINATLDCAACYTTTNTNASDNSIIFTTVCPALSDQPEDHGPHWLRSLEKWVTSALLGLQRLF